DIEVFFSLAQ
ncbi:unnamed protein product, partial [Allacma fusca]